MCVNWEYFLKIFSVCVYGGYYSTHPPGFARWGLRPRRFARASTFDEANGLINH